MKKRIILVLVALSIMFLFAGCNSRVNDENNFTIEKSTSLFNGVSYNVIGSWDSKVAEVKGNFDGEKGTFTLTDKDDFDKEYKFEVSKEAVFDLFSTDAFKLHITNEDDKKFSTEKLLPDGLDKKFELYNEDDEVEATGEKKLKLLSTEYSIDFDDSDNHMEQIVLLCAIDVIKSNMNN